MKIVSDSIRKLKLLLSTVTLLTMYSGISYAEGQRYSKGMKQQEQSRKAEFVKSFDKKNDHSKQYSRWTLRCIKQAYVECILFQKIVAAPTNNILFWTEFASREGSNEIGLAIVVPSIILPEYGIKINVDGKSIDHIRFLKCFSDGCLSRVVLDQAKLSEIEKGRSLQVIVADRQKQWVMLDMPLQGMNVAFADMRRVMKKTLASIK